MEGREADAQTYPQQDKVQPLRASVGNYEIEEAIETESSAGSIHVSSTVFVSGSNLPPYIREPIIEKHFFEHGFRDFITEVNVPLDETTCKSKGYAFVTFSSLEYAEDAVFILNDSLLLGKYQLSLKMVPSSDKTSNTAIPTPAAAIKFSTGTEEQGKNNSQSHPSPDASEATPSATFPLNTTQPKANEPPNESTSEYASGGSGIIIGNLSPLTTQEDIQAIISELGLGITSCIMQDEIGSGARMATVYLTDPGKAPQVIEKINQQTILGRKVFVLLSRAQSVTTQVLPLLSSLGAEEHILPKPSLPSHTKSLGTQQRRTLPKVPLSTHTQSVGTLKRRILPKPPPSHKKSVGTQERGIIFEPHLPSSTQSVPFQEAKRMAEPQLPSITQPTATQEGMMAESKLPSITQLTATQEGMMAESQLPSNTRPTSTQEGMMAESQLPSNTQPTSTQEGMMAESQLPSNTQPTSTQEWMMPESQLPSNTQPTATQEGMMPESQLPFITQLTATQEGMMAESQLPSNTQPTSTQEGMMAESQLPSNTQPTSTQEGMMAESQLPSNTQPTSTQEWMMAESQLPSNTQPTATQEGMMAESQLPSNTQPTATQEGMMPESQLPQPTATQEGMMPESQLPSNTQPTATQEGKRMAEPQLPSNTQPIATQEGVVPEFSLPSSIQLMEIQEERTLLPLNTLPCQMKADETLRQIHPSIVPPQHSSEGNVIIIRNLSIFIGKDDLQAMMSKYDIEVNACVIQEESGSNTQTATVHLASSAQVVDAVLQLNNQTILGGKIAVVPAITMPQAALTQEKIVPTKSVPVSVCRLMNIHLYTFIRKRCLADIERFEGEGGIFLYREGNAIASAPTKELVDTFIYRVVSNFEEYTLSLNAQQWNQLMSVGPQGKPLFSEVSLPFTTNPNIEIHHLHEQLAIRFIGKHDAVFSAHKHFTDELKKEYPVEAAKLETLVCIFPGLANELSQKHHIQVEGFHKGSVSLKFYGSPLSIGLARQKIDELISNFTMRKVPFPYPSSLLASAEKRLKVEGVQAYLQCTTDHETKPVDSAAVILISIHSFCSLELSNALEILSSRPFEKSVPLPLGYEVGNISRNFTKIEEEYNVVLSVHQPEGGPREYGILVLGYVHKDVQAVFQFLKKLVKDSSVRTIPLNCTPEQMTYLKLVLFEWPTQESKSVIASLPAQLSCPKKNILLTGTREVIDKSQALIIGSPLMLGLVYQSYTFKCNPNFLSQIEQYVLKPMKTRMHLNVIYKYERLGSSFTISIFSMKSNDFEKASKLMKAVIPKSKSFDIPPQAINSVKKILKSIERRHQARILYRHRPVPGVWIHVLSQEGIEACWREIDAHIDSIEITKHITIDIFQAKYLQRKHAEDLLLFKCEVSIPPVAKLPAGKQDLTITIHGKCGFVEKAAKGIEQWCSGCLIEKCQVRCPSRYLPAWRKRWGEFSREQEETYDLIIEFSHVQELQPKAHRKPSLKPDGDVSVTFFICGADHVAVRAVKDLIIRKENAHSLSEKQIKLTDNQVSAVLSGLKSKQLNPEIKYTIVLDVDREAGLVTLQCPLAAKADLLNAEKDILRYASEHLITSKEMHCGDEVVGLMLTSKSFHYFDQVEKVATQAQVSIKPLSKPKVGLKLKGNQAAIQTAEQKAQSILTTISQSIGHGELIVNSSCLPVFSTSDFAHFDSQLRDELCVVCLYPKAGKQRKILREVVCKPSSCDHFVTIQICMGDIVYENVDAIVNPANEDLMHTGGLAKSIVDVGGPSIQSQCIQYVQEHGRVLTGSAVCLGSGSLPCCKIIHVVGPRWKDGMQEESRLLKHAVLASIMCGEKVGVGSIALPAISTGIFGVPEHVCAEASLSIIDFYFKNCSQSQIHTVRFVLFTQQIADAFLNVIDSGVLSEIAVARASAQSQQAQSTAASQCSPQNSSSSYLWYWEDDLKSYTPYSKTASKLLTTEYLRSPTGSFRFRIGVKNTYTVDFQSMTQMNESSEFTRKVKYVVSPQSKSTKPDRMVQWYYRDDTRQFTPYLPSDSKVIESMFHEQSTSSILIINGRMYKFDFQAMQQVNCHTKYKRPIKREVVIAAQNQGDRESKGAASAAHEEAPPTSIVISFKGPKENLPKAKVRLEYILNSAIKKHNIPLPATSTPALERTLKGIAGNYNISCIIETNAKASRIGSTMKDDRVRILKLEGLEHAIQKTVTAVQDEIIKFQASKRSEMEPPPEWEKQIRTTQLFHVQIGTPEWNRVSGKFKETMSNVRLVSIQRIQNRWLWEKYVHHKERLQQKNAGRINEKELFHGTMSTPPDQIYDSEEGFDMRYCAKGMWGRANYFAASAKYSDAYAYAEQNGRKVMFLAKVLTGDTYTSEADNSLRMPPLKDVSSVVGVQLGQVRYDTVSGYTRGFQVYMTYSNDKAYPAYLIEYRPGASSIVYI